MFGWIRRKRRAAAPLGGDPAQFAADSSADSALPGAFHMSVADSSPVSDTEPSHSVDVPSSDSDGGSFDSGSVGGTDSGGGGGGSDW
jgi:hypothetical protein